MLGELAELFAAGTGHSAGVPNPVISMSAGASAEPASESVEGRQPSSEERFERAFQVVPPVFQEVTVAASSAWKIRPGEVLAAALHHVAGALGRLHRLRLGHLGLSCPFNLVFCSAERSRQDWIECLGEPWLGEVRNNLRMHQQFGRTALQKDCEAMERASTTPESRMGFDPLDLKRRMRTTMQQLHPCALARSSHPVNLHQAVGRSLDRCTVSLNGGVDPMQELVLGGRKQTIGLIRLLEMSWQDKDLPAPSVVPIRGVVHLMWKCGAAHVRKVVWNPHGAWRVSPPPVLLIRQHAEPSFLTAVDEEAQARWTKLLEFAYNQRCTADSPDVWGITSEAASTVEDFARNLRGLTSGTPMVSHAHFDWMPELVLRLGMLLSSLKRLAPSGKILDVLEVDGQTMSEACVLGWWLAQEHLDCLTWLRRGDWMGDGSEDDGFDSIDNIDEEHLRNAILERLESKGPLSLRELTRTFHKLPAKTRDRVVERMIRAGFIEKSADETVRLPEPQGPPVAHG